ncbi:MAG: hypothetical protein J6R67_07500 [Treponema sp.]|jgi:hypothetical protein|nr:hypothetical protein [Treponema sp.]
MEILTLENERRFGSNTITACFQDGRKVLHENAYQQVTQILGLYLNQGYSAPQEEIGKFINKVTVRLVDYDGMMRVKSSLVLMKN